MLAWTPWLERSTPLLEMNSFRLRIKSRLLSKKRRSLNRRLFLPKNRWDLPPTPTKERRLRRSLLRLRNNLSWLRLNSKRFSKPSLRLVNKIKEIQKNQNLSLLATRITSQELPKPLLKLMLPKNYKKDKTWRSSSRRALFIRTSKQRKTRSSLIDRNALRLKTRWKTITSWRKNSTRSTKLSKAWCKIKRKKHQLQLKLKNRSIPLVMRRIQFSTLFQLQ